EPNQASNVTALGLGGTRLIASAGANGMVFVRDPGDLEWTISNLDNVGIHAGLSASNSVWTGTAWVVGTNLGTFRSSTGVEPWTRTPLGIGPLSWAAFAPLGHHLFAAFDTQTFAVMAQTDDDGATWTDAEFLPGAFVKDLAISGGNLYAGRGDGLWRR